jgi:membrane associated rhomboid family serine protease
MRASPVGVRCPECAGDTARQRIIRPRAAGGLAAPVVTVALIAVNVIVFVLERGGVESSWAFREGALTGAGVAAGEWWRVGTAAFLHANLLHLGFNMFALWILGSRLEGYLGSGRYLVVYVVSGLSGSAGALLVTNPLVPTVGASGAIFGLLGSLLVLERRGVLLIGPIIPLLVLNLAFTFAVPGISVGGHVGGLVGGILATVALARFGRGHPAYGPVGATAPLALLAIVAADLLLIWAAVT